MKTGIELIAQERKEQLEKHDRKISDDVMFNNKKQLRKAAAQLISGNAITTPCPEDWYEHRWNKMKRKTVKQRLIIAGALIAAEIDRLENS